MGSRKFFLDDAGEYLETVVCSDRDKRFIAEQVAKESTRIAAVAQEQYQATEEHFVQEAEFAQRIASEGAGRVDEVLEDLRSGAITAKAAAKALADARRDLNKVREGIANAVAREEASWAEVNRTPGEWQRATARRAPGLFAGGRGLLELPTYE